MFCPDVRLNDLKTVEFCLNFSLKGHDSRRQCKRLLGRHWTSPEPYPSCRLWTKPLLCCCSDLRKNIYKYRISLGKFTKIAILTSINVFSLHQLGLLWHQPVIGPVWWHQVVLVTTNARCIQSGLGILSSARTHLKNETVSFLRRA